MCYFLCAVNWTDCYSTAYNSLSHNNTKASIVKHFTIYITASPHSCMMYSLFMTSCPCGLKEKRKEKGKFDGFQGSLQNPSKVRSNLKLNTTLYLHIYTNVVGVLSWGSWAKPLDSLQFQIKTQQAPLIYHNFMGECHKSSFFKANSLNKILSITQICILI